MISVMQIAKCKMQNGKRREGVLVFAFCILHFEFLGTRF
jgi:hypothetical protein